MLGKNPNSPVGPKAGERGGKGTSPIQSEEQFPPPRAWPRIFQRTSARQGGAALNLSFPLCKMGPWAPVVEAERLERSPRPPAQNCPFRSLVPHCPQVPNPHLPRLPALGRGMGGQGLHPPTDRPQEPGGHVPTSAYGSRACALAPKDELRSLQKPRFPAAFAGFFLLGPRMGTPLVGCSCAGPYPVFMQRNSSGPECSAGRLVSCGKGVGSVLGAEYAATTGSNTCALKELTCGFTQQGANTIWGQNMTLI